MYLYLKVVKIKKVNKNKTFNKTKTMFCCVTKTKLQRLLNVTKTKTAARKDFET